MNSDHCVRSLIPHLQLDHFAYHNQKVPYDLRNFHVARGKRSKDAFEGVETLSLDDHRCKYEQLGDGSEHRIALSEAVHVASGVAYSDEKTHESTAIRVVPLRLVAQQLNFLLHRLDHLVVHVVLQWVKLDSAEQQVDNSFPQSVIFREFPAEGLGGDGLKESESISLGVIEKEMMRSGRSETRGAGALHRVAEDNDLSDAGRRTRALELDLYVCGVFDATFDPATVGLKQIVFHGATLLNLRVPDSNLSGPSSARPPELP